MIRTHSIVLSSFAACLVLGAADPLPKAEAILDKYIEVTGGKAAYEKKRTEVSTAVMEFIGKGVKANMTSYHAEPNRSYLVVEIEGIGKMEEGTDGSVVWERSALKGPRVKTGEERAVSLRASSIHPAVPRASVQVPSPGPRVESNGLSGPQRVPTWDAGPRCPDFGLDRCRGPIPGAPRHRIHRSQGGAP